MKKQRLFHDSEDHLVIGQYPNWQFLLAVAAYVLAQINIANSSNFFDAVFVIALSVWAYEEAYRGVNLFRRIVGLAVLIFVVIRIAG